MIDKIALHIAGIILVIILFLFIDALINTHKRCFSDKERDGIAKNGYCKGEFGGTINTDYLSEICCDCPYLKLSSNENNGKDD